MTEDFNTKLATLLQELGVSREALDEIMQPKEIAKSDEEKARDYDFMRAQWMLSFVAATTIAARASGMYTAIASKKQNRVKTDWVLHCLVTQVMKPGADLLDMYVYAMGEDEQTKIGVQLLRGHEVFGQSGKA